MFTHCCEVTTATPHPARDCLSVRTDRGDPRREALLTMSETGKYGRVFDGKSFTDIVPPPSTHGLLPIPVPPTARRDSSDEGVTNDVGIFVSIPQFRDGKRCGRTLKRLFEMAKYPNRVYVGLIEQTDPDRPDDDPTCLREYCALLGYASWTPEEMEEESGDKDEREKLTHARRDNMHEDCPRVASQIRSVRFSHLDAKGPAYARSFVRKLLGNEEYCMQIDASADFTKYWDELAIQQWSLVQNEYAILSNVPERDKNYGIGGGIGGGEGGGVAPEVPRQCAIKIGSEGVPLISSIADGKAVGLVSPLLTAGTYSSSFTFAKCHLETNVPYDPFAVQLIETEIFPHYARLWTRGYDVYTPTINLIFRDNVVLHPLHHEKGHGETGERKWPKNDLERRDAHVRMKVLLNIHHGVAEAIEAESVSSAGDDGAGGGIGERIETARANLGIYGLGKRRSLEQLLDFVGISLSGGNNDGGGGRKGGNYCANPQWVPYDASISPRANLYDGTGKADDCDPEPIFALRTLPDAFGEQYDHPFAKGNAAWGDMILANRDSIDASRPSPSDGQYSMVILLWVIGLCAWYCMCIDNNNRSKAKSRGVGKQSSKVVLQNSTSKRKDPLSERVLKDV